MAKLNGNEILKYEWRQKLIKQKIKDGSAFELEPSGSIVITKYDEAQYDKLLAGKKATELSKLPFYDKNGKTYVLTRFKKSKEFGGGGGSGAGAALTKLTESAQALYCAAAWKGKDYSPSALQKATSTVYVDEQISNILTKLPEEWIDSCIKGADLLRSKYGTNSNLTFHRGSDWVGKIEKKFAALNRQEDRVFSNINKWTPADIWLVDSALLSSTDRDLSSIDSLVEFNSYLLKKLDDGKIVGVSLKKIGQQAKFSLKNVGKAVSMYKYEGYTVGKRGFFQSGDGYIRYDGGEIQMRYFTSVPSSWQGEIKGQFANQGKVGGGVLQKIVTAVTGTKLTKPSDVGSAPLDLFYKYYSELVDNPVAKDEFALQVGKQDTKWAGSKFLTTEIIYHIHKASDKDRIVSSILGYASSQSELSAPYAKVE
jgi:hypothetical protein